MKYAIRRFSRGEEEETRSFTSLRKTMKIVSRGMKDPEYAEKLIKNPTKAYIKSLTKQTTSPKAIKRFEGKTSATLRKNGLDCPEDVLRISNEESIGMSNRIAKKHNGNFRKILKERMED